MKSKLVEGATLKAYSPHHVGLDVNGKCQRHLCPFELVDKASYKGACSLGCPWDGKGGK